MRESFGCLLSGQQATLYTISLGQIRAQITDYGATLVRLYVPDADGNVADVILGYGDVNGYAADTAFHGAIVGRNANRIGGAAFPLNGERCQLPKNEGDNSLHSGPDFFCKRFWELARLEESKITFRLESPHGDQGYPGNATIHVTYGLEPGGVLKISYDGVSDRDTVFNFTNHSYFNLAGHTNTAAAMDQELMLPARCYTVANAQSIPTGETRSVAGTPMDFRIPKPIGRDIGADYEALNLQGGYDHNFEVVTSPAAVLRDPVSGRIMEVVTDCPGVQFYAGNYLAGEQGKDGAVYHKRSGICLETQYYPDALNHPHWAQPITRAGEHYHSETQYIFH